MTLRVVAGLALVGCTGPLVTDLRVRQDNYVATVRLDVDDPDGDVDGGEVDLEWNGETDHSPIGSRELDGDTISIERPFSPCHVAKWVALNARVTDAAGHQGPVYRGLFQLEGVEVYDEGEPNDRPFIGRMHNPVQVEPGVGICGNLSSSGRDGQFYSGDYDYWHLTVQQAGTLVVILRPISEHAEIDLWEIDGQSETPHYATFSDAAFSREVHAGEQFELLVAAGTGPHGYYGITFEWR